MGHLCCGYRLWSLYCLTVSPSCSFLPTHLMFTKSSCLQSVCVQITHLHENVACNWSHMSICRCGFEAVSCTRNCFSILCSSLHSGFLENKKVVNAWLKCMTASKHLLFMILWDVTWIKCLALRDKHLCHGSLKSTGVRNVFYSLIICIY